MLAWFLPTLGACRPKRIIRAGSRNISGKSTLKCLQNRASFLAEEGPGGPRDSFSLEYIGRDDLALARSKKEEGGWGKHQSAIITNAAAAKVKALSTLFRSESCHYGTCPLLKDKRRFRPRPAATVSAYHLSAQESKIISHPLFPPSYVSCSCCCLPFEAGSLAFLCCILLQTANWQS